MAINVACPSCGASYTLGDELAGKKGRCKKCGQSFVMDAKAREEAISAKAPPAVADADAQPAVAPTANPFEEGFDRPKRRKKKRRAEAQGPSKGLIVGLCVGAIVLVFVGLGIGLVLLLGGSSKDPELIGKWKGMVQVQEAFKQATKDSKMNPLAESFVQAIAQKAADQVLSVTVDFKKSGTAFFSDNTDCLGVPPASDGPWEIIKQDEDVLVVRLGPADAQFEARLAFHDRDTFTFVRMDKKEQPPVVFTRLAKKRWRNEVIRSVGLKDIEAD